MYTTYYWIVVTWQHDQGVTWHVRWGLLILVTTLLSLWALHFVKVKTKYIWFVTWPLDRSVTWLSGWGPLILSHYPTKFGIHRPWESGDITFLTCHVTTWLMCHVTCRWGSPHSSHLLLNLGSIDLWKWRFNVFYLSRDNDIKMSRDFLGGSPSS